MALGEFISSKEAQGTLTPNQTTVHRIFREKYYQWRWWWRCSREQPMVTSGRLVDPLPTTRIGNPSGSDTKGTSNCSPTPGVSWFEKASGFTIGLVCHS